MDADSDNILTLADAVYVLHFLFLKSDPPGAPYPACGRVRNHSYLPCRVSACHECIHAADQEPCDPKATRQIRSAQRRIVVQASLPALKALPSPEARECSQDDCTTMRVALGDGVRAGRHALVVLEHTQRRAGAGPARVESL